MLKSWAVPKRPTLDPRIKRLAVHVEDHPIEYAKFSGEIPRGEYGAGIVKIWDRGTYENLLESKPRPRSVTQAIKDGHLEVKLDGRKLKGGFALVRMDGAGKRENWLLIKMKDERTRKQKDGASRSNAKRASGTSAKVTAKGRAETISYTNQDKLMFLEAGITKGQVLGFYERIADRLLPYLRERPMTLERVPDGLERERGPHFWQKNTPSYYPSWIPRVRIRTDEGETDYTLVNNVETLLYLVNQGTVTFHPWLSRVTSLDNPDFVLFDLDPPGSRFGDTIPVARELRDILKDTQLECFVKTSGKDGLHVLVPWRRQSDYDEARRWALEIAERAVTSLPDIATIERSKAKRRGRVYIDVMQNVRGHHVVPPYVLRAAPQATVSTPLQWSEFSPGLDPHKYNLKTIFRRLAMQKSDPFAILVRSWDG